MTATTRAERREGASPAGKTTGTANLSTTVVRFATRVSIMNRLRRRSCCSAARCCSSTWLVSPAASSPRTAVRAAAASRDKRRRCSPTSTRKSIACASGSTRPPAYPAPARDPFNFGARPSAPTRPRRARSRRRRRRRRPCCRASSRFSTAPRRLTHRAVFRDGDDVRLSRSARRSAVSRRAIAPTASMLVDPTSGATLRCRSASRSLASAREPRTFICIMCRSRDATGAPGWCKPLVTSKSRGNLSCGGSFPQSFPQIL